MDVDLLERLMPFSGLPIPHNVLVRVLSDYARPNDKIHEYRKKGLISNLKKGVYCLHLPYQPKSIAKELAANHIYGPSYVSMDYVLSKQGLIPERVFEITSATTKPSKVFENELGRFRYIFLPLPYYSFGIERQLVGEQQYALVASVEKAVCDKIIRTNGANFRSRRDVWSFFEEDLRIEIDDLKNLDIRQIKEWLAFSPKKMSLLWMIKVLGSL